MQKKLRAPYWDEKKNFAPAVPPKLTQLLRPLYRIG